MSVGVGSTVDELRAFLGFAYSSPLNLVTKRIQDHDLKKLIYTAKFADKCLLESFWRWATETITEVICRESSRALRKCSPDIYVQLLGLNASRHVPSIKEQVTNVWLSRLRLRDREVSFAGALEAGEMFQLRRFLGKVYYEQLNALNALEGNADVLTAAGFHLPALSDLHKARLLMGHRSLSLCWDRIAGRIPPLTLPLCEPFKNCKCEARWRRVWNSAVQATLADASRSDILTKLIILDKHLNPSATHECDALAVTAREYARTVKKQLLGSLDEHFMGPVEKP
ncbi:hypothetical protein B0H11DRAFT_1008443 [Mycena galericulata]|nr:hypothetical protein B0H11DRAFT_1008443 [Mycena galericulata]